jgi:hypothetical protein
MKSTVGYSLQMPLLSDPVQTIPALFCSSEYPSFILKLIIIIIIVITMNTEAYRNVFFPAFLWTWNLISLLNGGTKTERIQGHSGEEDVEP